jgi:hypothetical protein
VTVTGVVVLVTATIPLAVRVAVVVSVVDGPV